MSSDAQATLETFFNAFKGAAPPLLLLDYDGTMASFRVDRFEAHPYAGVPELLARIQRDGQTRLAVVTGRPAGEIGPLLKLRPALEVWGLHGAERLSPTGHRSLESASPQALAKLDELRVRLNNDSLGGIFEDKPNACVMHWRGLSATRARAVEKRTRDLFEPLAEMDGLRLLEFEAGLELRVGRDKGGAVAAILEEMGAHGPVAYVGDDLTDESAFRAVNALHGAHLSVLMRTKQRTTEADIWLHPPADLRMFLKLWLRAVEKRAADRALIEESELAAV